MRLAPLILTIGGGLLLFGGVKQDGNPAPAPGPDTPSVARQFVQPRAEWLPVLQPVTAQVSQNPAKAAALAAFYFDFATALEAKQGGPSTFAQLQQALGMAGRNSVSVVPVLGGGDAKAVLDSAFDQLTGLSTQAPYDESKAVEALRAIAWACHGTHDG